MSDETTTTETTTETPAEQAKKARTVYPIRVCRVADDGAFAPIKGAPDFNEQRLADAWIKLNHKPFESYTTARIGPVVRAVTTLEVVT
jgi:hypothetical protein